ncbi:hypothetical protein ABIA27_001360 [Sinorhizobium fredii]
MVMLRQGTPLQQARSRCNAGGASTDHKYVARG